MTINYLKRRILLVVISFSVIFPGITQFSEASKISEASSAMLRKDNPEKKDFMVPLHIMSIEGGGIRIHRDVPPPKKEITTHTLFETHTAIFDDGISISRDYAKGDVNKNTFPSDKQPKIDELGHTFFEVLDGIFTTQIITTPTIEAANKQIIELLEPEFRQHIPYLIDQNQHDCFFLSIFMTIYFEISRNAGGYISIPVGLVSPGLVSKSKDFCIDTLLKLCNADCEALQKRCENLEQLLCSDTGKKKEDNIKEIKRINNDIKEISEFLNSLSFGFSDLEQEEKGKSPSAIASNSQTRTITPHLQKAKSLSSLISRIFETYFTFTPPRIITPVAHTEFDFLDRDLKKIEEVLLLQQRPMTAAHSKREE